MGSDWLSRMTLLSGPPDGRETPRGEPYGAPRHSRAPKDLGTAVSRLLPSRWLEVEEEVFTVQVILTLLPVELVVLATISELEVAVEELLVDTPIPVSALSLKHTSSFCLVLRDISLREFFSFRYTNCMVFV